MTDVTIKIVVNGTCIPTDFHEFDALNSIIEEQDKEICYQSFCELEESCKPELKGGHAPSEVLIITRDNILAISNGVDRASLLECIANVNTDTHMVLGYFCID